jgi:trans-2-enoyl-CoA reductase
MKFLKYTLLFIIVLTSCKTKKNMIDANAIAKEISAKKVAKKHIAANFDRETVDAKLKVNFNNGKARQSLSVNMKIIKDEVIWLRGTKFITIFKAKITPTSVSYYSPFAKNYFEGDFSMIKKLLGVEINFEQLQNLFLGQSLLNVKQEKQTVEIANNRYVLSPEKQAELFDIFFTINPSHFKLEEQSIINTFKNLRLDIKYPSYNLFDGVVFPSEINIKAKNLKSITDIDLFYKSVIFDTAIYMSFNIPSTYKRLEF